MEQGVAKDGLEEHVEPRVYEQWVQPALEQEGALGPGVEPAFEQESKEH